MITIKLKQITDAAWCKQPKEISLSLKTHWNDKVDAHNIEAKLRSKKVMRFREELKGNVEIWILR